MRMSQQQQHQPQPQQPCHCRKRRRPPTRPFVSSSSFARRSRRRWMLAMAATTTTTVLLTGPGNGLDYMAFLQPLYGDSTHHNNNDNNKNNNMNNKEEAAGPTVPDEEESVEVLGDGSEAAPSGPSRRPRDADAAFGAVPVPWSKNDHDDNDNPDVDDASSYATIPKVVLRPRTRLKLEAAAAAAAAAERAAPIPTTSTTGRSSSNNKNRVPPKNRRTTTASAPVLLPTTTTTAAAAANTRQQEEILLREEEREFMEWCRTVLGIEAAAVEIQTFEHPVYPPTVTDWEDDLSWEITEEFVGTTTTQPTTTTTTTDEPEATPTTTPTKNTLSIRGLAAARDIVPGETLIRIPVRALHSVATSLEQDPVLSQLLHAHRDWMDPPPPPADDDESDPADDPMQQQQQQQLLQYELPLLAIALLHHRRLGSSSPVAPYIKLLLRTPVEDMPYLWSAQRLRSQKEGVRIVAHGIRQEMQTMYQTVVLPLIEEFPNLLGPEQAVDEHGVWMFSYDLFQWAFAMVNSRHWQLPIPDLAPAMAPVNHNHNKPAALSSSSASSVEDPMPPASVPTESWVQEHGDVDDDIAVHHNIPNVDSDSQQQQQPQPSSSSLVRVHSFLAPVADLLNFGDPCTRVQYNTPAGVFEVVATCALAAGDEITFWYSNECDDVMMGVYGFAHPLVSPCRTSEEWRQHAHDLEEQLRQAYQDLEWMEEQLEYVEAVLADCDCCEEDGEPRLRHEQKPEQPRRSSGRTWRSSTGDTTTTNNNNNNSNSHKKHAPSNQQRIRRTWSRKSEF